MSNSNSNACFSKHLMNKHTCMMERERGSMWERLSIIKESNEMTSLNNTTTLHCCSFFNSPSSKIPPRFSQSQQCLCQPLQTEQAEFRTVKALPQIKCSVINTHAISIMSASSLDLNAQCLLIQRSQGSINIIMRRMTRNMSKTGKSENQ